MFSFLSNAVHSAVKAIRSVLGSHHRAPKPKPASKSTSYLRSIPKMPRFKPSSFVPFMPYRPSAKQRAAVNKQAAAVRRRNAQIQAENRRRLEATRRRTEITNKFNAKKMQQLGFRAKKADAVRKRLFKKAYNNAWYGKDDPTKFDKIKREYRVKAAKQIEQYKKNNSGGLLNWLTGSGTDKARKLAQGQLESLQTDEVKRYENRLNSFLVAQAKRKAEIEKKRFSSKAEFDRAVKQFSKWEDAQISNLEYIRAATTGQAEAYGQKAQMPNRSPVGTAAGWFQKTALPWLTNNSLFKYTLGSGDKNTPSLVTAPARAVNTVGNLFYNKRNYSDGSVQSGRAHDLGEAWRDSFNQRNFNISQPKEFTEAGFQKWYKTRDLSQWQSDIKAGKISKQKVEDLYRKMYKTQTSNDSAANKLTEFFADPLFLVPASKAGKAADRGLKWASGAAKSTKTGAGFFSKVEKLKKSKAIQWLGKEYKTPEQQLGDAIDAAKKHQSDLQKKFFPQIKALNDEIAKRGGEQLDLSVIDDLGKLTDHEAEVLQRMVAGKFSFRDAAKLRDVKGLRYSKPTRDKLMDIYQRWTDLSEKMKLSDNVSTARFGRGKRFYSPYTVWTGDDLSKYNYRKFRKRKKPQSAADLHQGAIDRFFVSNVDESTAAARSGLTKQRGDLYRAYKKEMDSLRSGTDKAWQATRTKSAKLRKFGRAVSPIGLWKKSVLKYRPAWTVNNVIYNTQAGVLAGGADSLINQIRLLRPKNWREAMNSVPDKIKADLTGELGGKSKDLNKFYNNVENWSRVSAFMAAKSKGLTDEQALKRVNKYLFDYRTKNWERPIKGILPFWAWNKNLAKASVQMPFDRPLAAKLYNKADQYQNDQFDKEFEKVVPQLVKLGYSEDEIQQIKQDQAKYYRGRLKVGNKWITTPFNAFSEKGLAGFGINPYLAALGESALSADNFGRPLSGSAASFRNRVLSKFPQYELGKKAYDSWRVDSGLSKPRSGWIGEKGSAGYGLTKERQGFDPSKSNYDRNMDPRAKLGQDSLAFLGVPRGLEFNADDLVRRKRLQKLADAYFALDTKDMSFDKAEAKRQALFKKYGVTPDEFYSGLLAKYDTDNTKRVKDLKAKARLANTKLFDEYAKQPKGTRNVWATAKLRELNDAGYFDDNPFKKSFDWINPDSVARATRQQDYQKAKASGDWSAWRRKYGDTRSQKARDYELAKKSGNWAAYESKYGRSKKSQAYQKAKASGDWSKFEERYGDTQDKSPYRYDGKYFKSAKSMERYKEGLFWHEYALASKEKRRQLLADHPEYNDRKDWTDADWDRWREQQKNKARHFGNFSNYEQKAISLNTSGALRFRAMRRANKNPKLTWL